MSEPELDLMLLELRAKAPPAPEGLRDRVRALPEPMPRIRLRMRPALIGAVSIAVILGIGAALISAIPGSPPQRNGADYAAFPPQVRQLAPVGKQHGVRVPGRSGFLQSTTSTLDALAPGSRLQNYSAMLRLRVKDLSDATKSAVRTTRMLGGYVAAANYSTSGSTGDSSLELRVPVQKVQSAIASFTELGTILSQRIKVSDLQGGLDALDRRIASKQKLLPTLTGARLEAEKRALERLLRQRAGLIRQGAYAKISLALTTRRAAAAQPAQPGRFDRFWGDAGDILGKEAIVVLYALVVAGPFALLAALALLGERTRRRRAATRLLEETG